MFTLVIKALLRGITAIALVCLVSVESVAQNEADVLRFSQQNSIGTVRTIGLCGAFGALGADLSSMGINPAGMGMYRRSDFGANTGIYTANTNSKFGNSSTDASASSTSIGNFGVALTTPSVNPDIPFVTLGFYHQKSTVYDRTTNLEDSELPNSLLGVFLGNAQGTNNDDLATYAAYPETAGLAWNTYLIDPNGNSTTSYIPTYNLADTVGFSYIVEESGSMNDNQFSIGLTQFEIFSLGATITSSKISFDQTYVHSETPTDPETELANWDYIGDLSIIGEGLNIKLGAILHLDWLKLGAAWHSPTKYSLRDRYSYSVYSNWKDSEPIHDQTPIYEYNYTLKTTSKLILSSAVIIDKYAIISVDYETLDYSKGVLSHDQGINGYDFYEENLSVQESYTRTHEARLGFEGRISSKFRARAGAAYSTSPFSSESGVQALGSSTKLSLGGEYRSGNKYLGVAWQKHWSSNDLYVQNPIYQGSPIDQNWSTSCLVIGGGLRL